MEIEGYYQQQYQSSYKEDPFHLQNETIDITGLFFSQLPNV